MARRKESGIDLIAALPWPVGVALGFVGYTVIRHGVGAWLSATGGEIGRGIGAQFGNGVFAPLAWLVLVLCWMAAAVSYLKSRKRKRLLETQTGLDTLVAMNWREFEMLVGEAFRRRGYSVEETGLGGADGGIDLILRKDGRTELVQCKQWRSRQVKPATVREMWGLVAHHQTHGVKIVCVGEFTKDAAEFARGKAIELINGERLLAMVREVQTPTSRAIMHEQDPSATPRTADIALCPVCRGEMVLRNNRGNGQSFWGCTNYPRCRGTRSPRMSS